MADLKEVLGDELYGTISNKLGDNKVFVGKDGDYIPRQRFNEVSEKAKGYEAQIADYNKQFEDLKKSAGTNTELVKQFDELKAANAKAAEEHNKKIYELQYNYEIEKLLKEYQSIDDIAVKAHLDNSKITLKDGKLDGIKEQLDLIKKEKLHLFKQEEKAPSPTRAGVKAIPKIQETKDNTAQTAVKSWNKINRSI